MYALPEFSQLNISDEFKAKPSSTDSQIQSITASPLTSLKNFVKDENKFSLGIIDSHLTFSEVNGFPAPSSDATENDIQTSFDNFFRPLLAHQSFENKVSYHAQPTSKGQKSDKEKVDCGFYLTSYIDSLSGATPDPSRALFIIELKNPRTAIGDDGSKWQAQCLERGERMLGAAPWRGSVIIAASNGKIIRFLHVSLFRQY